MPGYRQVLEQELAQPNASETGQSNLVSKLLFQACMGNISFAAAQQLAHAAFLDGIEHPELISLAQTGFWGQYPSHVKRDLETQFFKKVSYALPFAVETMVVNSKSNEVIPMKVHLFLPHLVIEGLTKYDGEHDAIFRTDLLESFWGSVKPKDPRLVALLSETEIRFEDLKNTVPLLVHGDGVEYLEDDSLEVQSFGPLLVSGDSFDCLFLMGAYPYSCTVKSTRKVGPKGDISTWGKLSKVISWSFEALQNGVHPTCGPDGEPLIDPVLKQYAGKPFKYRYVIWAISGDHEHHSNHYKLPHWKSNRWCWNCDCSHVGKPGFDFNPTTRAWVERQVEEELAERISPHQIFKIPGITAFSVSHDPLHVLYTNGILSHFFGSCLHTLLYTGTGKQAKSAPERLAILWQRLQAFYQQNHTESRLTNLQLSMILPDPDSPHNAYPYFKAKASETKHMVGFMVELLKHTQDTTVQAQQKLQAAIAISQFCRLLDTSGAVPTSSEASKAKETMYTFLSNYSCLNQWAKNNNLKLFHLVPKFHMAWHMAEHFEYLNPRFTWTFKCEDYVGKISKLAHGCTFGTSRMNVSFSVCSKYRWFMHLRLSRGCYSD